MTSLGRMLIDDFIALGWTTYGLAELERLVRRSRYSTTDDSLSDLNHLTELLFQLQMYERGKEHLENWLEVNSDHPLSPRYRLRLALYFNKLKEPQAALGQVEAIIASGADALPLVCLKGNLMNKCGRPRDQIIATFEEVVTKAPNWSEPKLELLEQLLLNGESSRAQRKAEEFLERNLALRDHTIISTLHIVARFCTNPHCWETQGFQSDMINLKAVTIPNSLREMWQFDNICDMLIAKGMADAWLKGAAFELRDWLKALESKFKKE